MTSQFGEASANDTDVTGMLCQSRVKRDPNDQGHQTIRLRDSLGHRTQCRRRSNGARRAIVTHSLGPPTSTPETVRIDENTTLHHVEIPLRHRDRTYHYSVSTGDQRSNDATFKAYPTNVLRVAVVADWQGKPNLSAIMKDEVNLLLTTGTTLLDFGTTWQTCHASSPLERDKP